MRSGRARVYVRRFAGIDTSFGVTPGTLLPRQTKYDDACLSNQCHSCRDIGRHGHHRQIILAHL
jgi:hypothetical protein